jgi:hypothetical protein
MSVGVMKDYHGYSGMSPAFCFFAPWVPFLEKEQSL